MREEALQLLLGLEKWFLEGLKELDKDAESYLLARGARREDFQSFGLGSWQCPSIPSPSREFNESFGLHGEGLEGKLIIPYFSPSGIPIGFESRHMDIKLLQHYNFPRAKWTPAWLGMTPEVMADIWSRRVVWIVEGIFDLFPLKHIIAEPILGSGTANLSKRQMDFLERFVSQVFLAYDMDGPGKKGADRVCAHLEKLRIMYTKVHYPLGKDPGQIWSDYGIAGIRRAFRYYITRESEHVNG